MSQASSATSAGPIPGSPAQPAAALLPQAIAAIPITIPYGNHIVASLSTLAASDSSVPAGLFATAAAAQPFFEIELATSGGCPGNDGELATLEDGPGNYGKGTEKTVPAVSGSRVWWMEKSRRG